MQNIKNKFQNYFYENGIFSKYRAFQFAVMLCSFCIFFGLFFSVFQTWTPYRVDDIWYQSFTQRGWQYFIDMNVWHYQNFNGRALVHLCLQIGLFLGNGFLSVALPLCLLTGVTLITRSVFKNMSLINHITLNCTGSCLFFAFYATLQPRFFTEMFLWYAAHFNYLFPLIFIGIFIYLFYKHKEKNGIHIPTVLFALICGMLTEQYASFTIFFLVGNAIADVVKDKKLNINKYISYLMPAILGMMSIMMSGGTSNRLMTSSYSDNILTEWFYNFVTINEQLFFGPVQAFFFLSTALFLTAYSIQNRKQGKRHIFGIFAFPVALVSYLTLSQFKEVSTTINFLFFFAYTIMLILDKKDEKTRRTGVFIFALFAYIFCLMLAGLNASGIRTKYLAYFLFPILLFYICRLCIKKQYVKYIAYALSLICAVGSVCTGVSVLPIMNETKEAMQTQIQQISNKENNTITYNYDIFNGEENPIHKYYYYSFNSSRISDFQYRDVFQIDKDTKIIPQSTMYDTSLFKTDYGYLFAPIIHIDNEVYIPFMAYHLNVASYYGKEEYQDYHYYTIADKYIVKKQGDDQKVYKLTLHINNCQKNSLLTEFFIPIKEFCVIFDAEYTFDEAENTYHFSKKD